MLSKNEKLVAAYLLDRAAEEFANHTCNDLDEYQTKHMSDEEKIAFAKRYHEYNGDPEEFTGSVQDFNMLPDWALMSYLAHELNEEAKNS